jgi:RNA polymerase sigma-70 factor, ECF subfamily
MTALDATTARTTILEARESTGHARDDGVAIFTSQQPRLLHIATRILGDTSAAEDIVQEVWVRWQRTDRSEIRNPPAFLATATTRVAINVLQSAHRRRETSVTPWLEDMAGGAKEPIDPAANAEAIEAAEHAVRVLLERLGATERAAYLLRKAFDYPYARIAQVLPVSAVHARQLVRRAQLKLRSVDPQPANAADHRRLVRAFLAAAQHGDFLSLEASLVGDIHRSAL